MSTGVPNPPSPSTPSLLRAHAHYMKGYLDSSIGHLSGSESWKGSGETEMREGLDELKVCPASIFPAVPRRCGWC